MVLFAPSSQKKKRLEAGTQTVSSMTGESSSSTKGVPKLFGELGVDVWLVEALKGVSIDRPTSVQTACIPAIFSCKDVLAAAKTGSGKTAAFALPILQDLARNPHGFFALVLTPTRY